MENYEEEFLNIKNTCRELTLDILQKDFFKDNLIIKNGKKYILNDN